MFSPHRVPHLPSTSLSSSAIKLATERPAYNCFMLAWHADLSVACCYPPLWALPQPPSSQLAWLVI